MNQQTKEDAQALIDDRLVDAFRTHLKHERNYRYAIRDSQYDDSAEATTRLVVEQYNADSAKRHFDAETKRNRVGSMIIDLRFNPATQDSIVNELDGLMVKLEALRESVVRAANTCKRTWEKCPNQPYFSGGPEEQAVNMHTRAKEVIGEIERNERDELYAALRRVEAIAAMQLLERMEQMN